MTGRGSYAADLRLDAVLQMWVVRSPYAHADIVGIDTTSGESSPGVVGVFTAAELHDANGEFPILQLRNPPGVDAPVNHGALARQRTRYVGEPGVHPFRLCCSAERRTPPTIRSDPT